MRKGRLTRDLRPPRRQRHRGEQHLHQRAARRARIGRIVQQCDAGHRRDFRRAAPLGLLLGLALPQKVQNRRQQLSTSLLSAQSRIRVRVRVEGQGGETFGSLLGLRLGHFNRLDMGPSA